MDGQHFCPDNSGYAEKRVQSYDFFLYRANFQALSFVFLADFLFSLLLLLFFLADFADFADLFCTFAVPLR